MPFTNDQIADINQAIETILWSKRRPPLNLRDQVREGQRIEGYTVDLFLNRPRWNNPEEWIEEPIARAKYIKSRNVWKIYWMRADLKWHLYEEPGEVKQFETVLQIVDQDDNGCFWG